MGKVPHHSYIAADLATPVFPFMHIAFTVESGFSHGNLHIARQFRYSTQQFEMSNDNLTMAEPNTKKNFFDLIFKIPKLSLIKKSDPNLPPVKLFTLRSSFSSM